MSERLNPFADITESPTFTVKPKSEKPLEEKVIAQISADQNFPSRPARKEPKVEKRKARIYRTGRNVQFNAKVTQETSSKIYRYADESGIPLGKILDLAMDALIATEKLKV